MPFTQNLAMEALQQRKPKSLILLTYYRVIFNFGYILCLVPFRIKHTGARSELHVSRAHQILCGIVQTLIMFEYISMTRFIAWDDLGGNRFNSLHAVASFSCVLYGAAFMYTFWFRRGDILKAARLIENIEFFDDTDSWIGVKVKILVVVICFWFTTFAVTDTTLHDNSLINGNVSGFYSQVHSDSRAVYLFETYESGSSTISRVAGVIFTFIHILIALPRFLLIQLLELVVLMTALCLWHIMRDFLKSRRKYADNYNNADKIFYNYSKLKELVRAVNKALSILTFSCIGVSLPFYASWIAIVFFHENVEWRHLIHFYFYFSSFFVLLAVAADFNSKCGEFYAWVSMPENSDGIAPNRMTSLVMDMLSNQISIRGAGIFIITYRFFGTILSVILTYTIIIIQFQVSKHGYCDGLVKASTGFDELTSSESFMSVNSSIVE